ncbi:MAG TPA: hypothetical protein VGK74_27275 [Symbiobacteriaceae bacterium]
MESARIFALPAMEAAEVADIGYRALTQGRAVAVAGVLNKLMVLSMGLTPRSIVRRMGKAFLSGATR